MSQETGPDGVAPAEQIGLSVREAAAQAIPRDAAGWAAKVERLEVGQREGVRGTNVAGRRLTGPVQGFGKLWQKTYSLDLGAAISPQQAISTWKAHFPEFWPKGNRFAGALAGISPGDVALLDLAIGGGVKLSTGVFVLYADEESFTFMTPLGHMFAGWITFSAERTAGAGGSGGSTPQASTAGGSGGSSPQASTARGSGGSAPQANTAERSREAPGEAAGERTVVQANVLMRANDPLYEIGMTFGGHRKEDQFWAQTLTALGVRLGLTDGVVQTKSTCVDSRRQWKHAGNIWHNAMLRSLGQTIATPVTALRRRSATES